MVRSFLFMLLLAGLMIPDPALANNLLWQQQRNNMMMQQQRMQQQRMQQQHLQQQRMQQQRAQQQRIQRQRQEQMRIRQAQMQARQQQIRAQQQRMLQQRQAQQQRRQQDLKRRKASRPVATRNFNAASARSAQITRNQVLSRERQRKMEAINRKSLLKRQFNKAAKERAATSSLAVLMRRGGTAARASTGNRFNSSSAKLRTLGPKFDAAKQRTTASIQKQSAKAHADRVIAEFRKRQAVRGARQTKEDFKSAARRSQPRAAFNQSGRLPPDPKLTQKFSNVARQKLPTAKENATTSQSFNKATGNRSPTPKSRIAEASRVVKPAPRTISDNARRLPDRRHSAEALRRVREIRGPKAVLGRYPEYKGIGRLADTRRFVVRNDRYSKMSSVMQWRFNKRFLDKQIKDKARIVLTTPARQASPGSIYARELSYLRSKGYVVSKDGMEMVRR